MIITDAHILTLSDTYRAACGVSDTTLSSRMFNDGKKLPAMRKGGTISLRRAAAAIEWFSANWPDGAVWPADIERPAPPVSEAAQ